MSDFQDWNPEPPREAPKPSPEFRDQLRAERKRVAVKLLFAIAVLALGVLWFFGWRP